METPENTHTASFTATIETIHMAININEQYATIIRGIMLKRKFSLLKMISTKEPPFPQKS